MTDSDTTSHDPKPARSSLREALARISDPLDLGEYAPGTPSAYVPAYPIQALGDPGFRAGHGLRYAYAAGSMAQGISSVALVVALAKAGMLAFFGSGGLGLDTVAKAVTRLQERLGDDAPYGVNVLHSPRETAHEAALVGLLLERGVHCIEASAYTKITEPLVRFRVSGLHRDASGTVVAPNRIVAKVSRPELATRFFAPAPPRMLAKLIEKGHITEEEAALATEIPLAQDVTAEADSGGHTDNRPAVALFPVLATLRDRMQAEHNYALRLRLGLAGGISTPASAAAAFAMGAAYIMTGSVNQGCIESGTSDAVRQMLAKARPTDVAMAPSAFLFESGGKVQVLKRGTMFPMRAVRLQTLYSAYDTIEDIPAGDRIFLEKKVFRDSLDNMWQRTQAFFAARDPEQIARAEKEPKHKMALLFRSYLGLASRWADQGDPDRQDDYQIWCGPAMGAFNDWVQGSFLEAVEKRRVVTVGLNILHGAAVALRLQALRLQGVHLSSTDIPAEPIADGELQQYVA